jgi:site-specific recombinase XerD
MVLDPLLRTTAPLVPEQPVPVLNVDHLRALLDVCEGREFSSRRDMAIIRLFLDTGIRLAELTALELDDVDLDHREATVLGKGRRRRTVVFGHKATLALDRYIRVRAAQRRADLPQLWLSLTGRAGHGPMTGSGIAQMIERRGQAAGITGLHPHVLRHTWAHYARLEDRLHDDEIMRLAGWRSRSMLNRYAASAADERARDAGKRSSLGDQL